MVEILEDMCMNEVEYKDNPNWDVLQKERAIRYLVSHPEWDIKGFYLWGSTRYRICVDVLIPTDRENSVFLRDEIDGLSIEISFVPEDCEIFSHEPRMRKRYESLG